MTWKTRVDNEGRPLTGERAYQIHFAGGQVPPARRFWAIALYDDQDRFVANSMKRYALGDWNLEFGDDGSVDIQVQRFSPGRYDEANWLPAPEGRFCLVLEICDVLPVASGTWSPPPVRVVQAGAGERAGAEAVSCMG